MKLDCRSLQLEQVPIPPDACFLVVHSGVSHRLQRDSYYARPGECQAAAGRLRGALAESPPEDL